MIDLMRGYAKFREGVYPRERKRFESLKSGQAPETLMVCCSDSRVDLNFVTQAKPGDIFYIRNAGNLVPPADGADCGSGAAIEFAVKNLPIRDVIVCGHTDCGAMKALRSGIADDDDSIVARWLRVAAAQTPDASELELDELVRANVEHQLDGLRHYDFIAERVREGELRLTGWLYDIGASELLQLEASTGEFLPLETIKTAV